LSAKQNAYALMADWIVQELTEGEKFEDSIFEPCDVLTQSYHWDALWALEAAGVLLKIEEGTETKFRANMTRSKLIPYMKSKNFDENEFTEMIGAFLGCGDLHGLVTSDPTMPFLVDEKSKPIFDALEDLELVKQNEDLYYWNEQSRKYMITKYLWPSEDKHQEYEEFKGKISNRAKQVIEKLSTKYRSDRPAIATKTISKKVFFLTKALRLLPKSDHGILTRTYRDPEIPESYIPDDDQIRQGFLWSGCSNDDFMYFGQSTPMSILKWQGMLVLMADVTSDGWAKDFAKMYLEEIFPNPWGVVKETKTWVYQ